MEDGGSMKIIIGAVIGIIILIVVSITLIVPLIDNADQGTELATFPELCIGGKSPEQFSMEIIAFLKNGDKRSAVIIYDSFLECHNPDEIDFGNYYQEQITALCSEGRERAATRLLNVAMYECTYGSGNCNYQSCT